MGFKKIILIFFIAFSCQTEEEKSIIEPTIFEPNYYLTLDDLLDLGFVLENADDGKIATKKINDSVSVMFQVDERFRVLIKEIWYIEFRAWDLNALNHFLLEHSSIIVTEFKDYCEGQEDFSETDTNFNFFVQKGLSGRFFQCNFYSNEDGRVILEVRHDHPYGYGDENNPLYNEIYKR